MRLTDAEFQALHGKLCRFFEWNRCQSPEDLSQEAILRGLKRMAEGQENYAENPQSYFFGIARNIVREERKKPQMQSTGEEDCPDRIDQLGALQWRILLRECLEQLDTRDRDLLVGYILDGAEKAARACGITPNALRIRVSRIRRKIGESLRGPADSRE